ncbi:sensor histidine kinase [Bacillota bacterium Meth-B3]
MKGWFKARSIQRKIFFAMLLSSVFAMLVVALTAVFLFVAFFVSSEGKSSLAQLGYLENQLDYFVQSFENYGKTLRANDGIQKLCAAYDAAGGRFNYAHAAQALAQIYAIIPSADYISSTTVYGADWRVLASTAPVPTPDAPPEREARAAFWRAGWKNDKYDAKRKNYSFSFYSPIFDYRSGRHIGYLELVLPEAAIAKAYARSVSDTHSIAVLDADGLVQSSSLGLEPGSPYAPAPALDSGDQSAQQIGLTKAVFARRYARLNWTLVYEITADKFFAPALYFLVIFGCVALGCLMLYALAARRISRTITHPIDALIGHTRTIRHGAWLTIDESIAEDGEIRALLRAFNRMITAQEELKNRLVESEEAKARLLLNALQEQINPHFLYNTLDNICSLAEIGETEALTKMVLRLSAFYRKSLSGGGSIVTIAEELEITRNYLEIMKIRTVGRFDFSIDCPRELAGVKIPKLVLQPVAENAIEHGFAHVDHPGFIHIRVRRAQGRIVLSVEDNGAGLMTEGGMPADGQPGSRYGLTNVRKRLALYFGNDSGLSIRNGEQGGCLVELTIREGGADDAEIPAGDR